MHRILLSLLMALVLALALAGIKRVALGRTAAAHQSNTLMAHGGTPPPPTPW